MNSFLELLPEQIAEKSIVIVYSPPSSGKTSFAKFLGRTPTGAHFCLGEKIQEWGFKNYPASFFSTKYCELIKSALDDFKKNKRFRLFMFDGVKSFADAKKIFEISNEVGVPISCAFILETVTGIDELERRRRDEDRNVLLERFQKYTNNKSLVLTFLKEKGVTMFTRNVANCKLVVFPWNGSTFPATKHLLSLLKISSPYCPWMPSGFVHTQKILNWVSSPNFFVSHKADGVRKTLLVLPEGCFFMDRSEAVEKVSILCGKDSPVVSLPVNSVLDGEYVVQNTQQYFIVFDALCISGRPIWHLTFAERLQELMSASGLATIQTSSKVSNDIWAVVKDYTRSSHNAIAAVLDYLPWFPADGLIFTPNILLHHSIVGKIIVVDPFIYTPYIFGPDKLFFKWQSVSQIRCEVLGISCKLFPAMFHNPMKIQFSPTNIVQFKWNGHWEAQLIRTDKTTGNSLSTVEELTQICKNPLLQEHLLGQKTPSIQQINNNCNDVNSVADSISSLSIVSQEEHNQIPTDFDLLFARIQTLLQDDLISENTDLLSGLTIYNYKAKLPKTANFRGLVPHIPSKTIVATPFSKFSASSEMKFVNPDDEVEITEKVDGSLGIVFVWKGKLYVATRRRFDSEQAIWASNWLEHYACTTTFQEGWTYLFEIIYSNNQVVIGYPYEGLVLLTANDPQGNEVSYESLIELRNNLTNSTSKKKTTVMAKLCCPSDTL